MTPPATVLIKAIPERPSPLGGSLRVSFRYERRRFSGQEGFMGSVEGAFPLPARRFPSLKTMHRIANGHPHSSEWGRKQTSKVKTHVWMQQIGWCRFPGGTNAQDMYFVTSDREPVQGACHTLVPGPPRRQARDNQDLQDRFPSSTRPCRSVSKGNVFREDLPDLTCQWFHRPYRMSVDAEYPAVQRDISPQFPGG